MVELPGELRGIAAQRVGQSLGIGAKFRLDALLDIGGMAAVYAATHRNGKKVAIKVLHKHYAGMPDVKERFLREGYVANKVDHRGAVQILDDDIAEDGTPFLVMELLLGSSFDKLLRSVGGKLPALEVLALGDQVLDVLDAFHKEAIVHRDIKPANLFVLKQGVVKVLDFGLARVRDSSIAGSPTASGTIIGTASYMAPEQAQGKSDIDARTDIFAVGAVMYEALAGHGVHEGRTPSSAKSAGPTPRPCARPSAGRPWNSRPCPRGRCRRRCPCPPRRLVLATTSCSSPAPLSKSASAPSRRSKSNASTRAGPAVLAFMFLRVLLAAHQGQRGFALGTSALALFFSVGCVSRMSRRGA
jgi:serine/threonine protein kinase